jgi:ATP-binding cassette subfamily C protein
MISLLIVAGIAEGVGLVTLLPLLEVGTGQGEATSPLTRSLVDALRILGVSPGLGTLLLLIVVMMALKAVLVWLAMKQVGYTVAQVATDLRIRLIRALLRARWQFFTGKPSGYFTTSISAEAKRASNGYQHACQAMAGLIQVLIYLAVVFMVSWQVAVLALLIAPVVLYTLRGFVMMSRQAGREQTRLMKELIARVTEVLPGIKPIKAMAREQSVLPLLEKETEDFNRAQRKAILATESLRALQQPAIVLVLALGLYGTVTWGDAPAAVVLVAAALFYRVMTTANKLQTQYQSITANESAFWSLIETVEEAESAAEEESSPADPAPMLQHEMRLEHVWFSYDGEPVLRDVNLRIPAGEMVTLVGVSGAGKTTLIDLITGLLHPDRGSITVDGIAMAEFNLADWRSRIGYVPQDVLLFHDTILRNVTLGEERFEREDVEWALRAAGAWQFVAAHPAGMHRVVGERGTQVSGGQRQRIGIARAIVSRPRLLVLDEVTTALDPETEAEVCRTLLTLRGAMTIVAVSHQPAIRMVSDRIYEVLGERTHRAEHSGAAVGARPASHSDVLRA